MGGFYIGKCPRIVPFLKTMNLGPLRGLGPFFSRNGAILGHSPIHKAVDKRVIVGIKAFEGQLNSQYR